MKKALLLLLYSLAAVTLYGQGFVVAAPALIHTAYEGVENPFTVALENCNCKLLSLSTDFGTITPGTEPCQFILKADKPTIAHLSLKKKEGKAWKEVGTMTCKVKAFPLPEPSIGGRREGVFSLAIFKVQQGIMAGNAEFHNDILYKLKRFKIEVLRDGIMIFSMINTGNAFEEKAKNFFQTLKPKDKILFNDIICIYPWGREVTLQPFDISIK